MGGSTCSSIIPDSFLSQLPGAIAKVLPVSATAKSLRGGWKGIVKIKGDIVKFNEAGVWENG
jgi:hypothetical protein